MNKPTTSRQVPIDLKKLSIVLSLIALNTVIGSLVAFLKLPIYLDTIGTMMATLLLGWRWGVVSALLSAAAGFFLVSPFVPFFTGTLLGVVLVTEVARRYNMYATVPRTALTGVVHGVVGTVLSAPVTYYLFDGFTLSGNDAVVAYFVSIGVTLFWAVVLALIIFAVIDRVLTSLFCFSALRALPRSFVERHDFEHFRDPVRGPTPGSVNTRS